MQRLKALHRLLLITLIALLSLALLSDSSVSAEPAASDYIPPSYSRLRQLRGTRPPPPPPTCRLRTYVTWFPYVTDAFPFHDFPVQGAEAKRLQAELRKYEVDRKDSERSKQIMAKILKITVEELRVMNKESSEKDDDYTCVTQLVSEQDQASRTRKILRGRWQHQVLSNVCKSEDEFYSDYEDGSWFPWRDKDYGGYEEQD